MKSQAQLKIVGTQQVRRYPILHRMTAENDWPFRASEKKPGDLVISLINKGGLG